MLNKIGAIHEGLPTLLTSKILLVRMHPLVNEVCDLTEGLATHAGTGKVFPPCALSDVAPGVHYD